MKPGRTFVWSLALPAALLLSAPALAQDLGGEVMRQGRIAENYYAAAQTLRLNAQVAGDVVAAGGDLDVQGEATGNTILAGGQVRVQQILKGDLLALAGSLEVRGTLQDDARVAGGEVTVYARVVGDLIAAGGRVHVAPGAHVGGRTALAGGRVEISGTLDKRLMAAGNTVVINGVVGGDTEVEAQHLVIGPTARLNGALHYRSPAPAHIDPAAKIAGSVTYEVSPIGRGVSRARWAGRGIAGALFGLALLVVGGAWLGLLPGLARSAPATLGADPWRSLLVGAIVGLAWVPAAAALAIIVVGLPLTVLLVLLLPVAMLLGWITAALYLGDWALRRLGRPATTGARLVGLLAAAVLFGLLVLVPYAGGLALLAALWFGTGALVLRLWRADAGR